MSMDWQTSPSLGSGPVRDTSGTGPPSRPRTGGPPSSSSTTSEGTSPACTGPSVVTSHWSTNQLAFQMSSGLQGRSLQQQLPQPRYNRYDCVPCHQDHPHVDCSVLPQQVVIYDEKWTPRNTFVGPYLEGDDMRLICQAVGGEWCLSCHSQDVLFISNLYQKSCLFYPELQSSPNTALWRKGRSFVWKVLIFNLGSVITWGVRGGTIRHNKSFSGNNT